MSSLSDDVELLANYLEKKDEANLINFITTHDYFTRMEIVKTYKASHGEDLEKKIDKYLSSDFKKVYKALFTPRIDYLCEIIYKSMKGLGTDEDTLIETMTTCSNDEIIQIVPRYQELFNAKLEDDINGDTSGLFKDLLISLIQGQRNQSPYPNIDECKDLTLKLKAYNSKDDKPIFIQIFSLRSYQEIEFIVREYHRMTGITVYDAIDNHKSDFSGDDLNMIKSLIFAVVNPAEYFATLLHKYLEKKKEEFLIRILVTQTDRNRMKMIKTFYRQRFGKDLEKEIEEKIKGSLGALFLKLIEN